MSGRPSATHSQDDTNKPNSSRTGRNYPQHPPSTRTFTRTSITSHSQSQSHRTGVHAPSGNSAIPVASKPSLPQGPRRPLTFRSKQDPVPSSSSHSQSARRPLSYTAPKVGANKTPAPAPIREPSSLNKPKATQGQGQVQSQESPEGIQVTSPLFSIKSDEELDRHLHMALEKSVASFAEQLTNSSDFINVQVSPSLDSNNNNNSGGTPSSIFVLDHEDGLERLLLFQCPGHPEKWKELLDSKTLCDCVIESNDKKVFPAHRVVLAANCPFFHEKFCNPEVEVQGISHVEGQGRGQTPITRLTLKTVDSESLKAIIDFSYTGDFEKNVDLIPKLLPIAKKFKMTSVLQQCCTYLIESLNPSNALKIYTMSKPYFCPDLDKKARSYILKNFDRIIRSRDYLDLEPKQLKDLIKDDFLNAKNEALVFEAIRGWVEFAPLKRKKYIVDLLSTVRFGLMSFGYFTNVVLNWRHVVADEAVRRALEAPYVLLTSLDSLHHHDVDYNEPLARPRVPYEIVFAVGGWSAGSPCSLVETYDCRADRWFLLSNTDPTPRAYHGLVPMGHYIYMIGGFDGQEHFSTVKRFDAITQVWEERSCMLNARCYVSCCELDGLIYACGGYNGRTRMNSSERYIPDLNQWEMITPMNRQRSDASAAALKGKIYIAGGFTGTEVLNSVETYDPKEDQWTYILPMNTARSGVSLVTYNNCLYAIGGFNGFSRLNTAERYDPEEHSHWKIIPDMSSPRSNFAAVAADGLLICIGGFNGSTTIPYVECYDSKVNEWVDAAHMNLNRSALSACVVRDLPNNMDYSYLHRIQELLGPSSDRDRDGNVD